VNLTEAGLLAIPLFVIYSPFADKILSWVRLYMYEITRNMGSACSNADLTAVDGHTSIDVHSIYWWNDAGKVVCMASYKSA
jgi:hypothetical protein